MHSCNHNYLLASDNHLCVGILRAAKHHLFYTRERHPHCIFESQRSFSVEPLFYTIALAQLLHADHSAVPGDGVASCRNSPFSKIQHFPQIQWLRSLPALPPITALFFWGLADTWSMLPMDSEKNARITTCSMSLPPVTCRLEYKLR